MPSWLVRLIWLSIGPTLTVALVLQLLPPLGVVLAISLAAFLNPFGRTVTERFALWLLAFLSTEAVVFLVAGVRVQQATAAGFLLGWVALAGACAALRLGGDDTGPIQAVRASLPSFEALDVTVALVATAQAVWVLHPFMGINTAGKLARLLPGWDFHTHFVLFADTYKVGRLDDLLIRSSPEFATSAPLLHPSFWALLVHGAQRPGTSLNRIELLTPYIAVTGLTCAVCVGLLAWVAGQLTRTLRTGGAARWSPSVAAALVGAFGVFGSPAALFMVGHTPFLEAVTILVVGSHLVGMSLAHSGVAHIMRAMLIMTATAVIVLFEWPPLLLGLVPAAAYAGWNFARLGARYRLAALLVGAAAGVLAFTKALALEHAVGIGVLARDLGGNAPFSVLAAVASIPLVVVVGIWLIRRGDLATAVCSAGPTLGIAVFAWILILNGARFFNEVPSYYLLKSVHGAFLSAMPLLLAVVVSAVAGFRPPAEHPVRSQAEVAGVIMVVLLACLGGTPVANLKAGFQSRLGVASHWKKAARLILRAAPHASASDWVLPVHWNTNDLLFNRWIIGLARPEGMRDDDFYLKLRLLMNPIAVGDLVCRQLRDEPGIRIQVLTVTPVAANHWVASLPAPWCPTDRITVTGVGK